MKIELELSDRLARHLAEYARAQSLTDGQFILRCLEMATEPESSAEHPEEFALPAAADYSTPAPTTPAT